MNVRLKLIQTQLKFQNERMIMKKNVNQSKTRINDRFDQIIIQLKNMNQENFVDFSKLTSM